MTKQELIVKIAAQEVNRDFLLKQLADTSSVNHRETVKKLVKTNETLLALKEQLKMLAQSAPREYVYFASFTNPAGQGMCEITVNEPITRYAQLLDSSAQIEQKIAPDGGKVTIRSYQLLRVEEGEG